MQFQFAYRSLLSNSSDFGEQSVQLHQSDILDSRLLQNYFLHLSVVDDPHSVFPADLVDNSLDEVGVIVDLQWPAFFLLELNLKSFDLARIFFIFSLEI